jgi:hypothetical protein
MQETVAVCFFIILNEVFILIIVRDVIWSWGKMNHWHYDSKIRPDIFSNPMINALIKTVPWQWARPIFNYNQLQTTIHYTYKRNSTPTSMEPEQPNPPPQ